MKIEKKVSSFFYYSENEEPVYRVDVKPNGDREYFVRDKRRHYTKGMPKKYYPYNLAGLLGTDDAKVVFIVADEREVEALEFLGQTAICGIPDPYGGTFPANWKGYLMMRTVIVIGYSLLDVFKASDEAWVIAQDYAANAAKIKTEKMATRSGKQCDTMRQLIDEEQMSADDFLTWVYANVVNAQSKEESTDYKPTLEEQVAVDKRPDKPADYEEYETGWVPFPLQVFPFVMQKYVKEISDSIKVDPAYVALPSLVTAAGTIGNARVIRLNKTWTEPSVLFGALLADPSTRKSPSMNWAALPVTEMDYELAAGYKALYERWSSQNRSWMAENGNVDEVGDGEGKKARPSKPKKDRLVISDITVETIVRELEINPRGLIMLRDELRAWFASFGRYKSGSSGGGDLGFWLESYRASSYIYDRKSGDQTSVLVPHCAVSVFGTIQPAVIARIFCREYFESGFVSRMLLALPPKRPGQWDRNEPSDETIDLYRTLFRRLRGLRGGFSSSDECRPVEMMMSKEAEFAWGEWYDKWQKTQFNSEGEIAAMLSKLEGQCARFALIFAVCDQVMGENDNGLIEERHITNAITLAEWFSHEAQRVYAFCGKTEVEIDDDRVIEKIENNGKYITARELYLTNKPKFKNTDNAKNILARLCESGKLKEVDKVPGRTNTRHTTYFTTILR